jgi:hypothetical protein
LLICEYKGRIGRVNGNQNVGIRKMLGCSWAFN